MKADSGIGGLLAQAQRNVHHVSLEAEGFSSPEKMLSRPEPAPRQDGRRRGHAAAADGLREAGLGGAQQKGSGAGREGQRGRASIDVVVVHTFARL
jgi:hypothetical protein